MLTKEISEVLKELYKITSLFEVDLKEFLNKFDINYNGENISDIGAGILKSNNLFPIAFQNTVLVYNSSLKNVVFELGNGYIDFAFIIKS